MNTQTQQTETVRNTNHLRLVKPTRSETLPRPSEDAQIIHDNAVVKNRFNVMNDRHVEEEFRIKEYRIWSTYGEATFDRTYTSSMEKNPDHLAATTAQIHGQKLLYLVLSKYFGRTYEPTAKEHLKIWPIKVTLSLPKMVRDNEDVVQKLWIWDLREIRNNTYEVTLRTIYNDTIQIDTVATVYLI